MFDRVLSCFRLYALFGFFALGFCGAQLNAENRNHQFKVYVNGLKVGEFVYAETFISNAYATRGIIRSTGLAAVITQYKFDGEAHGRRSGNTFRPTRYREQSDTGNRSSNKEMIYKNGVPKLTSSDAAKEYWLKPSTQKGTIDPMTALMVLLSEQPKTNPCATTVDVFDGARRFSIALSAPKLEKDALICSGVFTRVGGYSKKEWSKGKDFPFTMRYRVTPSGYEVERFAITTLLGRASFVRR